MLFIRRVCTAAALVLLLIPAAAFASSRKPTKPAVEVVLHPRVRVVARQVGVDMWDGRYVAISGTRPGLRLIDGNTGRISLVTNPYCDPIGQPWSPYALGGGWLLTLSCGSSNVPYAPLYSIASGKWTTFSFLSQGPPRSVAVGRRWVQSSVVTDYGCSEHCAYQYRFTNIATGQVRTLPGWHPGGTTVPDLNSAGLAAHLCAPLRVPQGAPYDIEPLRDAPEPLTFAGSFAVALHRKFQGKFSDDEVGESLVLERCGTRLRRVLTSVGQQPQIQDPQFTINRHAVIWEDTRDGAFHGLFLPSLKPFRISTGRIASAKGTAFFLTSRTLYVFRGTDIAHSELLATPAPMQPR